jgi:hypothetical protein
MGEICEFLSIKRVFYVLFETFGINFVEIFGWFDDKVSDIVFDAAEVEGVADILVEPDARKIERASPHVSHPRVMFSKLLFEDLLIEDSAYQRKAEK